MPWIILALLAAGPLALAARRLNRRFWAWATERRDAIVSDALTPDEAPAAAPRGPWDEDLAQLLRDVAD